MNIRIILLMLMLFSVNACRTHAIAAPPTQWAHSIKADANLYRVDKHLYRSEQLVEADRAIVKQLGIHSIINLRYFQRHADQKVFSQNDGIQLINHPLLTWHIQAKDIAAVLWQIERNQKNGAVLVHCYHGADRTGIIIAFYRIIYHGWRIADAKAEMQHGGYGYHRIWSNLNALFNEQTVAKVQQQLNHLRTQPQ